MQNFKLTLAVLGDPITDVEMMRCKYETFEVQADFKDVCHDWTGRLKHQHGQG